MRPPVRATGPGRADGDLFRVWRCEPGPAAFLDCPALDRLQSFRRRSFLSGCRRGMLRGWWLRITPALTGRLSRLTARLSQSSGPIDPDPSLLWAAVAAL